MSEQFDLSFKISKFDGNNKKGEFVYHKEFGNCSLLKIITSVPEYIENNINIVRSYFDRGVIRRDEFLLDKNSVREVWLNCCIHNDYSKRLGPAVFVYNDHIEFFSYGNPLANQTKSDFLMGISNPFNPELANILMKLGLIEQSGKGINTIVKRYGEDVFNFTDNYLQVNLPYNKKALKSEVIKVEKERNESINKAKSEYIKSLSSSNLKVLESNSKYSIDELGIKLNLSRETIKRTLRILKKLGIIERVGSNKSGYWKIEK